MNSHRTYGIALFFVAWLTTQTHTAIASETPAGTDPENLETRLQGAIDNTSDTTKKRHYVSALAAVKLSKRNWHSAQELLESMKSLQPAMSPVESALCAEHLGDCELMHGKVESALRLYEVANKDPQIKADPYLNARLQHYRAACYSRQKRYLDATSVYEALLSSSSECSNAVAWTYLRLSDCYARLGQAEKSASLRIKAGDCFRTVIAQRQLASADGPITPSLRVEKLWQRLTPAYSEAPARMWNECRAPWSMVLCIHGLGLDSTAFQQTADLLNKAGVLVFAMDVRGFGAWKADLIDKHVNFDKTLADIQLVSEQVKKANPGLPLFLLGESMGGAISLRAGLKSPKEFAAVIASVPAPDRYKEGWRAVKVAQQIIIHPGQDLDLRDDLVPNVTSDKQEEERWYNDPRARFKLPLWDSIKFSWFMYGTKHAVHAIDCPVFVTQGGKDRLVKASSTLKMYNSIENTNKNLVVLGGSEHLIFELHQPSTSLADGLVSWMRSVVGKPQAAADK